MERIANSVTDLNSGFLLCRLRHGAVAAGFVALSTVLGGSLASAEPVRALQAEAAEQWAVSIPDAMIDCQRTNQDAIVVWFQHEEQTVESSFFAQQVPVGLMKAEKVVPVRVVTPTAGPSASSQWQRVTQLADRYQVQTIPCLVFLDPAGKPVARFEELPASYSVWAEMVKQSQEKISVRDQAFAEASAAAGDSKAASLHRALQEVGDFWRVHYTEMAEQIIEIDADGSAGLRDHYRPALVEDKLDDQIQNRVYPLVELGQYAQARTQLDTILKELPLSTGQGQLVRAFRAQLLYTEGDLAAAIQELDKAIALGPATPEADRVRVARKQLEDLKSQ